MFDFENEIRKEKASREAKSMLSKMISEILLESDAPESMKMSVRLINASQALIDTLYFELPEEVLTSDNINVENAKKFCFFLNTITEQIKAFALNHQLMSVETEAGKEDV